MFHSIRNRLVLLCVSITVFAMLALSVATVLVARDNTVDQVTQSMSLITDNHAGKLADWVADKQRITHSLVQAVPQPRETALALVGAARQAGGFDDAYVVYSDKSHVFTHPMPEGYDGPGRPWYQQAAQTQGPAITPIYVDASTGKLVVSFVEAVRDGGRVTAVVGSDMHLDSMARMVASIRATATSFAFLIDEKGNILAHPDAKLALKPVTAIDAGLNAAALQRAADEDQMLEQSVGGAAQLLYARDVAGTPWTLVIAIDRDQAYAPVTTMIRLAVSLTALALVLAIVLVTFVVKRQLRGLPQVQLALEDIASGDGDLTRRLPETGRDELALIGAAFNRFAGKIAFIMRDIRQSADAVRHASQEIAAGNQDLSDRTAQQASSLEETAAAMEEITSTVQLNAENASQAAALATDASGTASQGGAVMQQVVQTMNGIDASARKIVDIISVIDGIAFQTNILALNAAVEAARAGEQGRGFAVVAGEVRTLAQRSAVAAKEIKALIESSADQIHSGSTLVHSAGQTMAQVVVSVEKVTRIVGEIDLASQEQRVGIAEVGNAIGLMDSATQQNAALVEQAAAAAQTLQDQAAHLASLVRGFRLDAEDAGGAQPAHPGASALGQPLLGT